MKRLIAKLEVPGIIMVAVCIAICGFYFVREVAMFDRWNVTLAQATMGDVFLLGSLLVLLNRFLKQ